MYKKKAIDTANIRSVCNKVKETTKKNEKTIGYDCVMGKKKAIIMDFRTIFMIKIQVSFLPLININNA